MSNCYDPLRDPYKVQHHWARMKELGRVPADAVLDDMTHRVITLSVMRSADPSESRRLKFVRALRGSSCWTVTE